MKTYEERFWSHVVKTPTCWLWTGCQVNGGYGRVQGRDGRLHLAHRVAYEMLVGPIPSGLEIDHVKARGCEHRNCVRPDHMEPVPHKINVLRGESPSSMCARKTTCSKGHPFDYIGSNGSRRCRLCRRELGRVWMRQKRARLKASA